jgi:hypothetical protein
MPNLSTRLSPIEVFSKATTPDHNGDQERNFSASTWMVEKLSNKWTDLTFQMKEEFIVRVKKEHMKDAGKRAQELFKKSLISMKEEGIDLDSDAEENMEAFGVNEEY